MPQEIEVAFLATVKEILDTETVTVVRGGYIFECKVLSSSGLSPIISDTVIVEKIPSSSEYYIAAIL